MPSRPPPPCTGPQAPPRRMGYRCSVGRMLPPAQAFPGQLHLGQAVVAQHLHPRDGGQRPVAVGELQDLVLLGVDVEVFCVRADLHLGGGQARGPLSTQACPPGIQSPSWGPLPLTSEPWLAARGRSPQTQQGDC